MSSLRVRNVCIAIFVGLTAFGALSTGLWPAGASGGIRAFASGVFASNRVEVLGPTVQSVESRSHGLFFANNTVTISDSPADQKENPPTKLDADVQAVLKVLHDQESAWNKGDLKGFMKGYWNSPDLSFYSGRDKRKGWQETYQRYQERYQKQGREMGKLAFSEFDASRLSESKMLVRGRWKLDMSDQTLDGLFSLILEKKPEGWRIIHDHTSMGDPASKKSKK